ncbi:MULTISPECIES: hypothetical protein [Methanoculleus]|jgi:hypothetical protein|nr:MULTISPECIES: hypothetical protein [Methanoculleus]MCC7555658.1 hypothetical protein [Methanoculleus marisnigri]UYU18058.1 hypothetical protein OH143_10160 [Methanoculleus submarinus]
MARKHLLLISVVLWLYVATGAMLVNGFFDPGLFFVLWLIGTAIIVQVATLPYAEPVYLTRQKYLIIAGIILFAHLAAVKILEVLVA